MTNKENIYNNLGQINVNDTKIDITPGYVETVCNNLGPVTISNTDTSYTTVTTPCIICGSPINAFSSNMICDDCKEAIEWVKKCIKTPKEEVVENEPEEVIAAEDELTYEEALGILWSRSDPTDECWERRCILEEAIERLRKYEKDYVNGLADNFMSKTVITGTARKSTEPPITTAICPHCNGYHTEQLYGTATLSNGRNDFCLHYKCLDCGEEFDKEF